MILNASILAQSLRLSDVPVKQDNSPLLNS